MRTDERELTLATIGLTVLVIVVVWLDRSVNLRLGVQIADQAEQIEILTGRVDRLEAARALLVPRTSGPPAENRPARRQGTYQGKLP